MPHPCGLRQSSHVSIVLLFAGYIDLEQGNFKNAIIIFTESLKIQKLRLEPDSRLILSTLDNIAYCHCRLGEFEKACGIYNELVELHSASVNKQSQREWVQSMKKQIYCQIRLHLYEDAFDSLRILEDYLETKGDKMKNAMRRTHKLMVQVNYQIIKFPTLKDYASRLACGTLCVGDHTEDIDAEAWFPKHPVNTSKMSGQRMTYA
jgi:pentatricopeptide repeat protein